MTGAPLVALVLALAPTPTVEIRNVAADRPPEINAVVRVYAADGRPVAGLGAADFSVFEDGRPVQGLAVRQSHPGEQPLAASLLVDTSGSMKKDDALRRAVEGTKAFLATLTPEDAREVIAFGRQIVPIARFGQPLDPAALDALRPLGDTPLRDALSLALDDVAGQAASAKAVVVLTDGKDEGSTMTQPALRAKAEAAKVPVHGIVLAGGDVAALRELADATGGSVRTIADPAELARVYTEIAAGLRTEYRLRYTTERPRGSHRLTVVARFGGGEASADREFLVAATSPAPAAAPSSGPSSVVVVVVVLAVLLAVGALLLLLRRRERVPAAVAPGGALSAPPGSPTPGRLQLVGAGASFPLVGSGIVVGRDPRAHIVIDDPSVSRTHVRLDVRGQEVWIEDLGSANGTHVNGVRVSSGRLQPGDVLGVGDQELHLWGAGG